MKKNQLPKKDLWAYASGEGATSITMNGIGNFAMLFYTQIMGLSPELAGIALSISTVWDALTDPVMGTVSDRTSTRYPMSCQIMCELRVKYGRDAEE